MISVLFPSQTVAPEVWDFVRSKRDRTESTLLAVSVDRVNVDVSLSTLWCPPAGVQVTSDGSVVSVSPSSFHHLYPADLSMPYAGSVPCPSDVACFVKCMSRLPELGKCTLPGVVPCMPLDPVCVMGAPLGDGASSFHACVTAACDALRIRKFDEAELLFTRATELAEEGDGRVEEAQALGGLALLSAYQHRYESARGLFMRASDVCCSAGNSVLGCKMEMGAALAACLIGQTDTRPLIWSALNRLTDPRAMQAVAGTIRRWSTECAAGVEATQLNILDTFLYSVFGCCGDFGSQSSKAFLPEMSSCVTMKATFNCERTDVRLRDFPQSLASLGSVVGTCLATLAQQATDTVFHKVCCVGWRTVVTSP